MTHVEQGNRERVSHRAVERVDKFAERRDELAGAALQTLAELGYARTSLREIAQNSAFSHGVLHYYFTDKVDLITHCVRQYKAECVTRYDDIVAESRSAAELRTEFAHSLAATMTHDAPMHRLWYDLRTQSLFEPAFRAEVGEIDQSLERMIWRIITRYAELAEVPLTISSEFAYGVLDGLFQQALVKHLAGHPDAGRALRAHATVALDRLVPLA